MINEKSVTATHVSSFYPGFIKPLYKTYSFSQIPQTLLTLLGCGHGGLPKDCITEGPYERVICILIDGFGWKFLQKYEAKYPFLTRFFKEGIVSKLTSQFPSTTAAHITTLCTNQEVGTHGFFEWFLYEPILNRVVAPLLYSFAGDKQNGSLESHLKATEFFPRETFFQKLNRQGIPSHVFQHESISHSAYSRALFDGAERIEYKTWNQAISLLQTKLKEKGLFYLYFGDFDSLAHRKGLESPEVEKALDQGFAELERLCQVSSEIHQPGTALLVTADHGMIDIHPSTTFYLNHNIPSLASFLRKGANGQVLAPAGSCRDFFLYVEPPHVQEVQKLIQDHLEDRAVILPASRLVEEGYFGSHVSSNLIKRMGDLVILPKGTNSVWWYEKGRFEQKFYAMHGGLTPDELETIFLFYSKKKPTLKG